MKKLMILALVAAGFVFGTASDSFAGSGKFSTTGIDVSNLNEWDSSADVDIRIWILTEAEIQDPPTTKAEADALDSYNTPPFVTFSFDRDPGTYYVVASNEAHYQGLEPDDAFEANVDFSLLEVTVDRGFTGVKVVNTDAANLLPEICLTE